MSELPSTANAESGQGQAIIAFALEASGSAAYSWSITSDTLTWSGSAAGLLGRPPEAFATGKQFASLLDSENLTTRYDTIINASSRDAGEGVPYQIEYLLKADADAGLPPMWIEDTGRWFADATGQPALATGVIRIITERHNRDQVLSALSHTDALTGLMNRNRLEGALAQMLAETVERKASAAFAVVAIRNIDIVNDAYGFAVADEVIAAMSERLRGVMRMGDGIGRYAGSKFGILLNNCTADDLPVALERFLEVARGNVIETSSGPVWALLSAGAVVLPEQAATPAEAKALAEESLSQALRQSGDGFVAHAPTEEARNRRLINVRCATEIVECLRDQRFQLAFQPLVNATDGTVACHEALLRMRDSGGELVAAGHLVPVAEQLGLIRLVDRAVTQLALDTLHRYPAARLSINLSATTANDPRWNSQIIDMIEAAGRLAERLTLEITETTALADLTSAITFLERLRATGCGVAIDDFGAGFTSFRNLRDLPIDVIKLDGSYCCNLTQDPENVYFARTLIDMAHHFGIRTVAEWVETQQDAEVLASLGIDFLQGHYLGEPSVVAPWPEAERSAFDFDSHAQGIAPVTLTATPLQPVAPVVEPPAIPSVMPSVMEEAASGVVFTEVPADLAIEMLVEELAADEPVSDATLAIESPADEVPLPSAEESFAFVEQVHSLSAVDSEEQAAAPADGDISMFDELEESLARLRQTLHLLGQTTEPAAQRLAG